MSIPSDNWNTFYSRKIIKYGEAPNWIVQIKPKGNVGGPTGEGTATITWHSSILPSGSWKIKKIASFNETGGIKDLGDTVIENMISTSSFTVTGGSEYQYFQITYTPSE